MTSVDTVDLERYPGAIAGDFSYDSLDIKKAHLEKLLNILGYIPCVSSGSGITRGLYGLIEVVKNCVAAVFVNIADRFGQQVSASPSRTVQYLRYAVHGCENIVRGLIECLPLVINNLILIAYDWSIHRHEYPAETAMRLAMEQKV